MFNALLMVTILCFQCDRAEQAYSDYLGYTTIDRGQVTEQLASSWGAEALAGNDYFVMQPESKEEVYLRFVYNEAAKDYQPMQRVGWNATELLAKDPKALAESFAKSDDFKVIAEPAFLSDKKNTIAFQALGPSNELLYFAHTIDLDKAFFKLGQAKTPVDRVFIMVLGVDDLGAASKFYRDTFKMRVTDPIPYKIGVLSEAYGLPKDTLHNLALAPFPERFMFEIDQYPESAKPLPEDDQLTGGVLMISVEVDDLSAFNELDRLDGINSFDVFPYDYRNAITIKGAVGERIELIEKPRLAKPKTNN